MARRRAALALAAACVLLAARGLTAHGDHDDPGHTHADMADLGGRNATGRAVLAGGGVALTWALNEVDASVTFHVAASEPSYAVGVAVGTSMVDATAYVAWLDGHGAGNVSSYWMSDRRGDHVLPTGEALRDVAVQRGTDGALSFRFTRPLRASAGVRGVNASSPLSAGPTPFGWGLFPSWTVRTPGDHPVHDDMHVRWSHRPTVVNLASGASEADGEGFGRALTAHAVLMALAWGVFFPGAAAAARHLKPAGGPSFFYAHVALNSLGFVLLCAGFGAVYQSIRASDGPGARHFDGGFHTRLGLAVFVLAWLQPAGGLLRPAAPPAGEKVSQPRRLWELGHRLAGRVLIGLGLLAAATGIALAADHGASRPATQAGLALWILYCVLGLGGGSAALELLRRRREAASTPTGSWVRMGP